MILLVSFQQLADNLGDQERRRQAEEEEEVYCLDWYGEVNVTFESGIHLQKGLKICQNGYTIDLVVWNDLALNRHKSLTCSTGRRNAVAVCVKSDEHGKSGFDRSLTMYRKCKLEVMPSK